MTTVIVDDLPPSYEQAVAMLERWESTTLTDAEKMEHQQEILDALSDQKTTHKFIEQCGGIGKAAVAIDKAFDNVKIGFADIVRNYRKDFPEVEGYARRWDDLQKRWNGEDGGLLWSSRQLATFTASQLGLYGVFLQMVEEIKSNQDLKDAQEELKVFSEKKYPIEIKPEIADGFKHLRTAVQDFTKDFQLYIEKKKQILEKEAIRLKGVIENIQAEIETINEKINKTLIALGCSLVFGLVGALIVTGVLAGFLGERERKEHDLAIAQGELKEVNRKQKAIVHMQSDFDRLKPDIELICVKLGIFAEVWASARSQAIDFKNKLDEGQQVLTKPAFKLTLELAMKTSSVLIEGLKAYATHSAS